MKKKEQERKKETLGALGHKQPRPPGSASHSFSLPNSKAGFLQEKKHTKPRLVEGQKALQLDEDTESAYLTGGHNEAERREL